MQFLVSEKYRFLLGWSAKCGCSSIKKWFVDIHDITAPADGDFHKFIGYGDTEYSYVDWRDPERYRDYKKFLVVRNPYKRLVSGFINKYVGEKFANDEWDNFSEFVRVLANDPLLEKINKHHFAPQFSEAYADFAANYSFDRIIKLENLREGLNEISTLTGAPHVNVGLNNVSMHLSNYPSEKQVSKWSIAELVRNKSALPPRDDFYDFELVQLTEKIYKPDFENLLKLGIHYLRPAIDTPTPNVTQSESPPASWINSESNLPKVSVVIPVYNTAEFLPECLGSVLNQTLVDIEIIIVDDCSSDNSRDVMSEYRRKDRRIKTFAHETNQGLPVTRNTGMEKARGEYLVHLDSDDFWVEERMLEQLYTLARLRDSEIIKFGGRTYENGAYGEHLARIKPVYSTSFLDEPSLWHFSSTFLYFFNRSFIEENGIRCKPGISIGEDQIFLASALTAAKKISTVEQAFYAYRVNSQSLMRRRWTSLQFREDLEHTKVVTDILEPFPEVRLHYANIRIRYWLRQVFPRAFEDLDKTSRLEFFCNAVELVRQFDRSNPKLGEKLAPRELRLLEMLCQHDNIFLEEHFREEVNPRFSKFCATNMTRWPPYSLKQQHAGSTHNTISGTLYIHAGTHKTGSTAVQDFFYENRAKLAEDDIHYCHGAGMWGPNAHLLPISLVDPDLHLLGWPRLDPERIWHNIMADYHASGCTNLLLSSEFFTPEYLETELPNLYNLKALLGENTVRFIFYVRPQDERLNSGYAQLVRSGVRALQQPFDEYIKASLKSHDYAWLLQEYEKVFGRDSLLVNRYHRDDFRNGDVCHDIVRVLGLDSTQYLAAETERNETWHKDVVAFIQKSNAFPGNQFSIGQKDRFGHYVRAWFSPRERPSAHTNSGWIEPELHDQLVTQYRQSNLEVSERYLPKSRSLEIGDRLELTRPHSHRGLTIESATWQMLLDTWSQVDTLQEKTKQLEEKTIRLEKKRNPELRIRQHLSIALRKTLIRIKNDINSVRKRLANGRTHALRWISATKPVNRYFRNAEGQAEYNFSLNSSRKPDGISAMIRVKNEQALIFQCLESIYNTFDEIVIIDNNSEDSTLDLVHQFVSKHDRTNKIRIEQYPFNIARCGSEHQNTPENSLHSLAYYYNWCLSRCTRAYVCKWDADMLLNGGPSAREKLRQFFMDCSNSRQLVAGQLDVQTIYIDKNGNSIRSKQEVNREVRVFPNTESICFEKGFLWERLSLIPDMAVRVFTPSGIEEIKDVRQDEFTHWTTDEVQGPRKEIEWENYNLIKQGLAEVFPARFSPKLPES